jgi:hypothetical protein
MERALQESIGQIEGIQEVNWDGQTDQSAVTGAKYFLTQGQIKNAL